MKKGFYPRLAWSGIRKNRRMYVPYLLSCIGMVMMFYIIQSLSISPLLHNMRGGSSIETVLVLGKFVIAIFALIFLYYTNSFLIRRRNKEFGLYNILGMDKHGIARIVLWESLIVAALGLGFGILLGIVFSKFAELGLFNVINKEISYRFTITPGAILTTLAIFGGIFAILALRSILLVRRSRPLELLHSENTGEKPPRANFVIAALGILLLGAAYFIAVSIRNPLAALLFFFAAVVLVIAATYLLFISGSVALCRLLQKNKKYYYHKNHFVSVSSMTFRMKRNGAGLASVCILCTMVLVMISSTASLYFGKNYALRARFPRENEVTVSVNRIDTMSDDKIDILRADYLSVFDQFNVQPKNLSEFRCASTAGLVDGGTVDLNANDSLIQDYSKLRSVYFVSTGDYNRAMGTSLEVAPGDALVYGLRCRYTDSSITFGDTGLTLRVVGTADRYVGIGTAATNAVPSLMFVVHDYEGLKPLEAAVNAWGDPMFEIGYYFGYDLDADDETAEAIFTEMRSVPALNASLLKENGSYSMQSGCFAMEKDDFFTTFGGLFFLGIMLSIVFVFAAAMIIYYKQVSEGLEDQANFGIMQKVGMTRKEIQKSIDSQILTVFFAPLLMAGIHLCFAFPMVWKVLQLFNLNNLGLVIAVTAGAFAVFGLIYFVIYKLTARAYFKSAVPGGSAVPTANRCSRGREAPPGSPRSRATR